MLASLVFQNDAVIIVTALGRLPLWLSFLLWDLLRLVLYEMKVEKTLRSEPFLNETSFRKEPHFAHVPKTLKIFQSFLNFHFVKNGSENLFLTIFIFGGSR
jgi:hypothetical protein